MAMMWGPCSRHTMILPRLFASLWSVVCNPETRQGTPQNTEYNRHPRHGTHHAITPPGTTRATGAATTAPGIKPSLTRLACHQPPDSTSVPSAI